MNYRNFSLDFLQPSGVPQRATSGVMPAVKDPWSEAVRYYGAPVLQLLQKEGSKEVEGLFNPTKEMLNQPDLQFEQFENVVFRMIENGQLQVVRQGDTTAKSLVALPIGR